MIRKKIKLFSVLEVAEHMNEQLKLNITGTDVYQLLIEMKIINNRNILESGWKGRRVFIEKHVYSKDVKVMARIKRHSEIYFTVSGMKFLERRLKRIQRILDNKEKK